MKYAWNDFTTSIVTSKDTGTNVEFKRIYEKNLLIAIYKLFYFSYYKTPSF